MPLSTHCYWRWCCDCSSPPSHLLLLLLLHPHMPPHHPTAPTDTAPHHAANPAPCALRMLPICCRPTCQKWGGAAHLRWSPQCPSAASAAAAAAPCEPLKRRTCTRRCNGRCGRSVACSWRRTCAALSSARATPWQVAGLLCTSKMQGGVGECGCKRWQCGEQYGWQYTGYRGLGG